MAPSSELQRLQAEVPKLSFTLFRDDRDSNASVPGRKIVAICGRADRRPREPVGAKAKLQEMACAHIHSQGNAICFRRSRARQDLPAPLLHAPKCYFAC